MHETKITKEQKTSDKALSNATNHNIVSGSIAEL